MAATRVHPHELGDLSFVRTADDGGLVVVHGDLLATEADVVLLPTDLRGHVRADWGSLLGQPDTEAWLTEITDDLHGEHATVMAPREAARYPRHLLAVDVAGRAGTNDIDGLGRRLASALQVLEAARPGIGEAWRDRRARPLLAMPVIGTRGGRLDEHRGAVIRELLRVIDKFFTSPRTTPPFDIVLVCRDLSDYAAVQSIRRGLAPPLRDADWLQALAEHARAGRLAVLFGAGASAAAGLPMWREFLGQLATDPRVQPVTADQLRTLDVADAATILVELLGDDFQQKVADVLALERHSVMHGLLANLQPSIAITTNYDRGYEMAVAGRRAGQVAVLPWETADRGQPSLLKLHGDVDLGLIVLARQHFAAMEAFRRPLTGVLQERMLAGHVLAVGTSMSDATLVRAAEETRALVGQARGSSVADRPSGTVILTERDPAREVLLAGSFAVAAAGGATVLERARQVDLVLDWLGMQASSDLSFMLDPRYRPLVSVPQQRVVDRLLDVAQAVPAGSDDALTLRVAGFLRELGWESERR